MFRVFATAVVTAILTSAFWVFYFNIGSAPSGAGRVDTSGDVTVVDPASGPPVAIAESVEVGPAGLAIPVAGIPMVERIVRWLATAGIDDIVLNLHALPDTITSVVGDGRHLGVRARYSWEQPFVLGSAGGPRQALDIVGVETFLIVNGDTLTDLPLAPLVAATAQNFDVQRVSAP